MIGLQIYVDADACPVKKEIEQVATRHKINVILVSNGGIRPSINPIIKIVVVDQGLDKADNYISEEICFGDIVITADIPLASRVLEKGCLVIKNNGEIITENNIGNILAMRNLMTDLRAANPFHTQTHKQFSKIDRVRFLNSLEKLIQQSKKIVK